MYLSTLCSLLITSYIFLILYKRRLSSRDREKTFDVFLENRCGCHICNKDDEFKISYLCNKIMGDKYVVMENYDEKEDFIIYIKEKNVNLTFLQIISMYEIMLDYKYLKLCKIYDLNIKATKKNIINIINKNKKREEYHNYKLLKNNKISKLFKINNIY